MERRKYLIGCAGVTAGLAGCGNLTGESDSGGTDDDDDDDDDDGGTSTPAQVQTVQQFYLLVDQGEIEKANELIHPDAQNMEVDVQRSERYRDDIDLSLVESELLGMEGEEAEVRIEQRFDSEDVEEPQTSEVVIVLRQYEGEWRIFDTRPYDPEETPADDEQTPTDDEQTGEDTDDQVSDRLQVVNTVGTDTDEDRRIEAISLVVKKAPGAADIDLSRVTIQYVTSNEVLDLTSEETGADGVFVLDSIQDDDNSLDADIINDSEDRAVIGIIEQPSNITPLEEGARAEVKLVTQSGAETTVSLTVPESLEGEQTVAL